MQAGNDDKDGNAALVLKKKTLQRQRCFGLILNLIYDDDDDADDDDDVEDDDDEVDDDINEWSDIRL